MLYSGNDISRSKADVLNPISFENLIAEMNSNFLKEKIENLRKVKSIDKDSFTFLKKKLPYFIGATFKNNLRSSINFEGASYLILDVDGFANKNDLKVLKERISKDLRVKLAFVSPSGIGLKILFSLNRPIKSLKGYSDFYKIFSRSFAKQYNIENLIDFGTSDATRICFYSYDPTLFFNPNSSPLEEELYVSNLVDFEDKSEEDKDNSEIPISHISNSTYKKILRTLNPKSPKPAKKYFVPDPLIKLKDLLPEAFLAYELNLAEITDINYGIKVKIEHGPFEAFINVYFGKNGFSIVKRQHNRQLEDFYNASQLIIENVIYNSKNNEGTEYTSILDSINKTKKECRVIQFRPAQ